MRRRLLLGGLLAPCLGHAAGETQVPVLVYHRFATAVLDSMTVRTTTFEAQLRFLEREGCRVVDLADLVAWRLGRRAGLPERAVVLTADDGHRSQYELMAPLLRGRGWPITLFIYPSAISNATYAMTWAQLGGLFADPLYGLGSHTWWHPNLVKERRTLDPAAFRRAADFQLRHSKEVLERRFARAVPCLAWPFGVTDDGLMTQAAEVGYDAAFTLGAQPVTPLQPRYALPRYLVTETFDERRLARLFETPR